WRGRVEPNVRCPGEQLFDGHTGLEARERRADAKVDPATEREMRLHERAIDVEALGVVERRLVEVGGGPHQQHARPCRDGYAAQRGVTGGHPVVETERAVASQGLFDKRRY